MKRSTLSRHERLTSRKAIEELFASGKSFSSGPLRLVWSLQSAESAAFRVLFSVSKKKFPRAVDRNRIKRLLRESYRTQKPDPIHGRLIHLAIIYLGSELPELPSIQKHLSPALKRLITQMPDA